MLKNRIVEKPYGWVFSYNSKEYLKSKNIFDMLIGTGPAIVNKFTKEVSICGSAHPKEHYIDMYEKNLIS